MSEPLRLLMLEDSPADAELNERVLRKGRIDFTALRVDTLAAFSTAVDEFKPDLILADYHLPGFNGLEALAIARAKAPETPYLFISGAMGEELAVDSIKQGATDYILKDRLARLPAAVQRALQEKSLRARQREAEERYQELIETMRSGVVVFKPNATGEKFTITAINRAVENIDRVRREDVIGSDLEAVFPGVRAFGLLQVLQRVSSNGVAEHFPPSYYQDERVAGWRENHVYRLASGEVVAVYDDVSERVERETQVRSLNRVLRTISACNESLVRARSEDDLLHAICRDIIERGGYLLAWVTYPDAAHDGGIRAVAHFGDEAAFQAHAVLEHTPEHAPYCLISKALRERRSASYNRLHGANEGGFDQLDAVGVGAKLALPLLQDDELLGVLSIFSTRPEAFDDAEIGLMEELAADLSYGIAALRTAADRDRYLGRYSHAMRNTVVVMARTLEMRDPYTSGHQQRVTALAQAIGREMGLDPRLVEGLSFGGMIHDIGKIAVPSEILTKPSRLSVIEYQLIRQHSETGYDILRGIDFPWPVADMVVQHHERLDGSGYPHGLTGGQICLEAHIIAVADVVEAMSSHRPYRASLGIAAALAEIEQGSGRLYDPAVVAACLKVVRTNGMQLPEIELVA
ncbi:MAG: HD domain-containing protein [Proteobacteria bacterium]|nr:HD domain-containing protein [Pseudomonadota bacterium]